MQESPLKQTKVLFPYPLSPELSRNRFVYRKVSERVESFSQTDHQIHTRSTQNSPNHSSKSTQTDNDFCDFFTNLSNEFQKLSDEFQKIINPANKSDQQSTLETSTALPKQTPSESPKPALGENFCSNIGQIFNDLKKETDNFFKGANGIFNLSSSRKKSPSNVNQKSVISLRF